MPLSVYGCQSVMSYFSLSMFACMYGSLYQSLFCVCPSSSSCLIVFICLASCIWYTYMHVYLFVSVYLSGCLSPNYVCLLLRLFLSLRPSVTFFSFCSILSPQFIHAFSGQFNNSITRRCVRNTKLWNFRWCKCCFIQTALYANNCSWQQQFLFIIVIFWYPNFIAPSLHIYLWKWNSKLSPPPYTYENAIVNYHHHHILMKIQ